MSTTFACPSCQAVFPGARSIAGRQVRCPQCDNLVTVAEVESPPGSDGSRSLPAGAAMLAADQKKSGETVMLESIDSVHGGTSEPIEVTDVIDEPPRQTGGPPGTGGRAKDPALDFGDEAGRPEVKTKRQLEETELDMTPMVDVTFLLLIFFMVTAAFTLQKSLEIPKPSDDQPSETVVEQDPDEQSDYVTVMVDEYNTFHVTTVDWEEEAPSEQDLHIHLRRARDGDSTGTVPTKLRVEAHGESLHEKVVAALDAGTATGFEEVQLATIEDD